MATNYSSIVDDAVRREMEEKMGKLTGYEAIEYAEEHGLLLCKYNDPIEDARDDLTPSEARDVAREDPGLIYLEE